MTGIGVGARPVSPVATLLAVLVAAPLLAGCGFLGGIPAEPDNLDTWSARPLPPDPAIAAVAVADHGSCRLDDPADEAVEPVPQILVQDRRTQNIAAFLVQNVEHFGGCIVSRSSGEAGGATRDAC